MSAAPTTAASHGVLPFAGFQHLGGPLAGVVAGSLAALVAWMDPRTPPLAVGLCTLGALNAYLLALLNRSLRGAVLACIGGFFLGLVSFAAVSSADALGDDAEMLVKFLRPLLVLALVPCLGAGPVVLAAWYQSERPSGYFLRCFLAAVGGGLGGMTGLIVFGMFRSLAENVPQALVLVLALTAGNYVLFRIQVACLMSSIAGVQPVESVAGGQAAAPAGGHAASDRDDEP